MNQEDVRISVVIPSYNSGPYLKETLESIFSQSHPPYEVIVQDAGSTDGTLEVLESYGDRIQSFVERDRGQSDAVNKAIARASGDLLSWCNADDVYLPGAFANAATAFAENDRPDLIYGDWDIIDAEGNFYRRYSPRTFSWDRIFLRGSYVFTGATFFRRDVFERFGGLNADLHYTMDLEFFLRVGRRVKSVHINHPTAQLRLHGDNKSAKDRWKFVSESHRVRSPYVRGSLTRRLQLLGIDAMKAGYVTLAPLRYSRGWSRLRGARRAL